MSPFQITGINISPLKSGRMIRVQEASFDSVGIENDRRLAILDVEKNAIRTQRNLPKLALIESSIGPDYISLNAPGMPKLVIPRNDNIADGIAVKLFSRKPLVIDQGKEAEKWLSAFLKIKTCDTLILF